MSFEPVVEREESGEITLIGKVIYIDRYENAIVNIRKEHFEQYGKGRRFTISFNSFQDAIDTISTSYGDVPVSDMVALFESNNHLEIAINQGNAGSLLGLKIDTRVRVNFS